ncbi:hypothetical protein [Aureimonas psammosilenae]|nr:hypothetical protein [Aureimonas psammosilenae]
MKLPVLLLVLSGVALSGCLSKVPPEQRAGDSWVKRAEMTSGPTTLN